MVGGLPALPRITNKLRSPWLVLCGALLASGVSSCKTPPPSPSARPQQPVAGPAETAVKPVPTDRRDKHSPGGAACQEDDEAQLERDQLTRALAADPDDPATLADAAELYLSRLAASSLHSEIALLYARRGVEVLERRPQAPTGASALAEARAGKRPARPPAGKSDPGLYARLLLLEGQALLDLGRAREALPRLDAALQHGGPVKHVAQVRYERAVALFELCQLAEARRAFAEWLLRYPQEESAAWAHHHLGLTLEMLGETAAAERELAEARRMQPEHFPALLPISAAEFREMVLAETRALPADKGADLEHVTLQTADLPDLRDLTLEEPPLSPTILGLFRGLPLGEEPSEPRAILLYRKNLLRMVRSREELVAEVRTTLLHELGHLRGADDNDLRDQGLE
jgi:predicted Zn-dependent protease with MMP-like domain/TolA-binding protein